VLDLPRFLPTFFDPSDHLKVVVFARSNVPLAMAPADRNE
jgi:hypothetical protein